MKLSQFDVERPPAVSVRRCEVPGCGAPDANLYFEHGLCGPHYMLFEDESEGHRHRMARLEQWLEKQVKP